MKQVLGIFEEIRERYKLHLTAGRSGLEREVKWVYQAEEPGILTYLRGGELVVTTGLSFDGTEAWLLDMVNALRAHEAAGLIINIGEYIRTEHITQVVRQSFDEAAVPLFLMPWDVHIADLMQEVSSQLFRQGRENDIINNILTGMLLDSPVKTAEALKLEPFGFRNDARYNVLCLSGLRSASPLTRWLTERGLAHHVLQAQDVRTLIFECPEDDTALALADAMFEEAGVRRGSALDGEQGLIIGMGEAEYTLSRIKFSYLNAVNALKMARKEGRNFLRFRDLGFYQILLSIEDTDLLHRLKREYLGAVEEYDRENGTGYLETLETYLQCKGSVNEVAAKMYTHRNTINYRMKKIRELLPFDMDDPDSHFLLKMAFYIRTNLL